MTRDLSLADHTEPPVNDGGKIQRRSLAAAEVTGLDFVDLGIECRLVLVRQMRRVVAADAAQEGNRGKRRGIGRSGEFLDGGLGSRLSCGA